MDCENVPSSPTLSIQKEATVLLHNLSIAGTASSLSAPRLPLRTSRRKLTVETSTS